MHFIQSNRDPAVHLRAPEIEVVAKPDLWAAYRQEGKVFVRGRFPLHALSQPRDWRTNPVGDKTWALYFHSLYFIGTVFHGVCQTADGASRREEVALGLLDLLLDYFDFLETTDVEKESASVWDDHAAAYRSSFVSLAYSNILPATVGTAATRKFHAFAQRHAELLCGFIESGRWLLSNHTLFHLEGLCDIARTFFKGTADGARYIDVVGRGFDRYFDAAISVEDGTAKEHAMFYHAFLMERTAAHVDFLRLNGVPVRDGIDAILARMNRFLWLTMPRAGTVPAIGDTKYDMVVNPKYYTRFLAEPYLDAAIRYVRSSGREGERPPFFSAYRTDGYYLARDFSAPPKGLMSIFLEKRQIGPHGHCDGSSFVSFVDGQPLFIDSGGPYKYGDKMRYEYFQTQIAHSTVVVGKPERYLSEVVAEDSGTGHAFLLGRVEFTSGAEWLRLFGQLGSLAIVVVDIVRKAGAGTPITARFHLAPTAAIDSVGDDQLRLTVGDSSVALNFAGSTAGDAATEAGAAGPKDIYAGRAFVTLEDGACEPSSLLIRRLEAGAPSLMAAAFAPGVEVRMREDEGSISLEIGDALAKAPLCSVRVSWGTGRSPAAITVERQAAPTAAATRTSGDERMNQTTATSFIDNGLAEVNGWLADQVLQALDCCVEIMRANDHIWAHSLEIGVHEGKFFVPIELVTPDDRQACAIDVFDLQMFNIDRSGHGNLERFKANVDKYCRLPDRVVIERADAFDIRRTQLDRLDYSIISVDGGHTVDHVGFDLDFAASRLQPGGLIILDDFPNASWLGVLEGASLYFNKRAHRIAPFATGYNKLFITTTSHQKIYFQALRDLAPKHGLDVGRVTHFAGWPIQALAKRHFRPV